jgi:hypothetical protein
MKPGRPNIGRPKIGQFSVWAAENFGGPANALEQIVLVHPLLKAGLCLGQTMKVKRAERTVRGRLNVWFGNIGQRQRPARTK